MAISTSLGLALSTYFLKYPSTVCSSIYETFRLGFHIISKSVEVRIVCPPRFYTTNVYIVFI